MKRRDGRGSHAYAPFGADPSAVPTVDLRSPFWAHGLARIAYLKGARDRQFGAAFAFGQTFAMQMVVLFGDITSQHVDAIVNAANTALLPGGGVDGAIHDAAGDRLLAACIALGGCDVGDAKVTPGFKLAAQWIIHTVGPVYQGGHRGEAALLASCYRRSLEVADSLGVRSIAFPAISTGAFGYPEEEASRIAIGTLREATTTVAVARLVAFDRASERRMSYQLETF